MLRWIFCFFFGVQQRDGKTGKREVALICLAAWCYGFFRLGANEAMGTAMPLTADVLRMTFPFVSAMLVAAFGMEQLKKAGWLAKGEPVAE